MKMKISPIENITIGSIYYEQYEEWEQNVLDYTVCDRYVYVTNIYEEVAEEEDEEFEYVLICYYDMRAPDYEFSEYKEDFLCKFQQVSLESKNAKHKSRKNPPEEKRF